MSDQLDALFNQARGNGTPAPGGDPLDATWDKPKPANDADPLDTAWHDDAATQAGISLTVKREANPERAGEANRLARETGLPGDTAENELEQLRTARNLSMNTALARGHPPLAQWATNPRNAAVAVDDMGTLANLGKGITAFLAPYARGAKALGKALYAGAWDMNEGIYGIGEELATPMFGKAQTTPISTFFAGKRREAAAAGDASQPKTGNFATDSLLTGVRSLPTTAAAIGLSLAGAPSAGLALFGGVQGGQSFGAARDAGKSAPKAAAFGAVQGAIEAGTEALPMNFLVRALGKARLPQFLAGFIGREVGSEEVSTLAQNAEQWANLNPEKPFSAFLAEQPAAIAQTALATIAVGGSAGILHIAASAHNAQQGRTTADATASSVDGIMLNAAQSKVRERDPSAFHEYVASHTVNTPAEYMYWPGPQARDFLQSDRFDPSDDGHAWLSSLADQANEAAALGGDVVIPVADAATHLAGTKAWDAIKNDVRINPGGMSVSEAKTAEDHFDADLEARGAEVARQGAVDQAAAAPAQAVYEDVRDRLMHAGQTPDVADKLAQLYAAHATAVGTQLGTDAAGYHASNPVEFRQVLPPALAKVQAVDGLDMVINALKRGAEKQTDTQKFGPSLLDFIAKRGGIEDRGGDIAAMGAENWHREKPFRKRLLRAAGADQSLPGMEQRGQTPNSPDSLALAAWEAGYFPEHAERPHVNDLLEAIDSEIRGKPRFASDSVTEQQQLSDAAEELRAILEQRGLDPEKTTRETIRQELQRYSQEAAEGRSLDQDGRPDPTWIRNVDKVVRGDPVGRELRLGDTPAVLRLMGMPSGDLVMSSAKLARVRREHPEVRLQTLRDLPRLLADPVAAFPTERGDIVVAVPAQDVDGHPIVVPLTVDTNRNVVLSTYGKEGGAKWIERQLAAARREGKTVYERSGPAATKPTTEATLAGNTAASEEALSPGPIPAERPAGPARRILTLRDVVKKRTLDQPAYHGSPHIFDRFSLGAFGTGEGHSAFGWGLYFAGKKAIAEHYRRALSRGVLFDGQSIEAATATTGSDTDKLALKALQAVSGAEEAALARLAEWAAPERASQTLRQWFADGRVTPAGRLYHVEIPEDGEYLLWDKPVNEQPEAVQQALKMIPAYVIDQINEGLDEQGLNPVEFDDDAYTAAQYYRMLSKVEIDGDWDGVGENGKRDASMLLKELGVGGIKYLDATSRSDGDGSFNYVVFDDNSVSIQQYEQSYGEGVRGRATFGTGKPIIEMFAAADLSTMIHETGHVWLEELQANAMASETIAADWQTVQDWFAANGHAVGADGVIPTEAHELWARGFERFAMEGKAPSSALRRAFDAFRAWMLHIYKVVDNLHAPITPEIRDVMNRMLATQEETDAAEDAQNLKALFTDAAQAGMTEEEFAAYQAASGEARNEAYDALIYRTMQTIRQQRTKEWKAEEALVRADVTARINQRSEFKALHLLRTGKWLGEPEREGVKVRLDRQWLIDTYGADALSMLPKGVPPIYGEKGTDADSIAEMVGFGTGDEMVRHLMGIEAAQKDLRDAGDKRSVRNRLIDEETTAEMRDRHGDPLNDGSIEEEALAAVHNDRQGELIASEARALTRRTGDAPTPYKLAREWAARKVAEGQVVDVASRSALQRYAKAAAKAAKAAEAAILKGDVDETFRQKQAQLLNHALLVEAKKAADDVDAAVTRLSKIARRATMKSVEQDYLDRAHALLEQFDFRPRSQKGLDEQEGFSAWAAAQRANGVDIVTPPRLEARGEHYSRISVEELRGLRDSVDQLIHLGRHKQKLIDAKEQRDFDEVVDEAVNSVGQLPPRDPSDNMTPSAWERFTTRIASADAALLKMETIVDRLDSGNPNGVFNRLVFRPLADAQARARAMMAEKITAYQDMLKLIPKEQLKRWSERVSVPELINKDTGRPWVMTRDRLMQMALNMGNAGNADKLARGYGWDEATVMRVLDRELTADEWRHVQAELDLVGSLWPQIAAMYKRLNGVEPEKIEARPIVTRHGTFAGGYFPVIYDSTKDATAEAQSAAAGDALFENIYTRATTSNGFTEKRTNVARPINLAYGLTSRHLAEVIHDLTHREAIINADKFLSDKRIVRAVRATMGPEVQKQFRPWLQHVANEMALDKRGLAGWESFAKKLRTNTSIMGMGYRVTVIMSQVAGYTNSAEQIGTRWLASGFKQASNPKNWAAVVERSAEVRARMETLDRDIQDNIKTLVGDHSPVAQVKRFAFTGIGWMDRVVVIPTWLGAFDKAQSEGMTEDDAIYYADKIVRNSQGANAAKDLAAVQRGHEFWKLATMFYSYASAFVNRQHAIAWDAGDAVRGRKISAAPELIARSFWLFAAAPLMQALITGHGPGEDDDWGSWAFWNMFSNFFMGVPLLRDITGSLSSGYGYSYTPVERMIGTVFKVSKDVKHLAAGEDATQAVRHGIEAVGYGAGLPLGQVASATQFALDVANGDQDPETVGDWYRGLTTGKAEKK